MKNPWLEKITKKTKREEARKALQKWCIRAAYNDELTLPFVYGGDKFFGFEGCVNTKSEFFKKYPEYKEFDMELRITWNMYRDEIYCGSEVTGIPKVTFYPNEYWEHCAEIARRAKKAIPKWHYKREVDAKKHLYDRVVKFWEDVRNAKPNPISNPELFNKDN